MRSLSNDSIVKEKNISTDQTSLSEEHAPNKPTTSNARSKFNPRTCRICLEEVQPTSDTFNDNFPSLFHPPPIIRWISEDPASGRLIRPCLCRGSQKYVHERCLQLWRHANTPSLQRTNFWQCPTCKFEYRLERMAWSRFIISPFVRIGITLTVILVAIFACGFIADPIINLYTNPINTISSISTEGRAALHLENDNCSWSTHFLKGFVSIGVFGIAKTTLAMSSWQWIFKGFGVRTTRRRDQSPHDIMNGIPWIVIIFGVITFLIAVWRFVQAWTDSMLEKAGESVADVQGLDDDEENVIAPDSHLRIPILNKI